MPFFSYIALNKANNTVKGRVEAETIREARDAIRQLGYLPTKVVDESNSSQKAVITTTPKSNTMKAMSLNDKIDFTSTLRTLIATGTPIIETLVFLEQNSDSKKIREVAYELRRQIIAGMTFAETVDKHRKMFGRVFTGLVKAGEDSGELDKTLERMLELLKKQADIKAKVTGALVYPAFVIVLAALVVTVMLAFVFPAFEDMFKSMGAELPFITQVCINLGKAIQKFWYVVIVLFWLVGYGIYAAFNTPSIKKRIDIISLKIPLLNQLLEFANFSNFIAVMQVAYDAGVPIVDCLYLASITLDNWVLKEAIMKASTKVQQGTHLSVALRSTGKIPPMVLFMIATGEQSGRLGELLYHCTDYIDRKLDSIIDKFTKLMEPIMLVVIGTVVLFLALALYMPLFGLYTNM